MKHLTKHLNKPIKLVISAFDEFLHNQLSGGLLLLLCTVVALILANSPYAYFYDYINQLHAGIQLGGLHLELSLAHWVNDGLMAIFFLLVGLEIKREMVAGELSALSTALLPIIAAIGGMAVPGLIYWGVNHGNGYAMQGWAIPMATDIAFSLGMLTLFGSRIPRALVIFLAAVAIVDDLGAVLIIAVFYTRSINMHYLMMSIFCLVVLCLMKFLRVQRILPYLLVGLIMWALMLKSGVHATVAGALLAFTIPAQSTYRSGVITKSLNRLTELFRELVTPAQLAQRKEVIQAIEILAHEATTPLQRLEHRLHIPVNFLIVPIFVLCNAGVSLAGISFQQALHDPVSVGIVLGLVLGKCIGIFGATALSVKTGLAKLPRQLTLGHIFPLSVIAGIGFTMAIFISNLSFGADLQMLNLAKVGILSASLIAAILGYIIMWFFTAKQIKVPHDSK